MLGSDGRDFGVKHSNHEWVCLCLETQVSMVAQMVKNPPAMQEIWVQSLGWEDFLEEGMATHPSILVWRVPWTEQPGRLHSSWGHKESDTTE